MARIALPTQVVDSDGVNLAFTTATDVGATFSVDPGATVEIFNGGGVATNVTIETGGSLAGVALADVGPIAIPAGERRWFGGFDARAFARPSGVADPGKVYINLSAVATVSAAAYR